MDRLGFRFALVAAVTLTLTAAASASDPLPLSGYQVLPSVDIGPDVHDPLCDDPSFFTRVTSLVPTMAVCDALNCDHFHSGGCIKQWTANETVDSYISLHSCAPGTDHPQLVSGACESTSHKYLSCSAGGASFEFLNTYALPPQQIKEACDSDSRCTAFVLAKDKSSGSTYQYDTQGFGSFIKVPV
jgi:hypothetical protein